MKLGMMNPVHMARVDGNRKMHCEWSCGGSLSVAVFNEKVRQRNAEKVACIRFTILSFAAVRWSS